MEPKVRHVEYYRRPDGSSPLVNWLLALPLPSRAAVQKRIDRIERGLLGDYKSIEDGIIEFRIDFGPGFRIYAGLVGESAILLTGSDKTDQRRTIPIAKTLWKEFKQHIL